MREEILNTIVTTSIKLSYMREAKVGRVGAYEINRR